MNIRGLVAHNFWLKVAAVVLAFALWAFVMTKGYTEITVRVPIEFRNVPAGLQLVDAASVTETAVVLRGHKRFVGAELVDAVSVVVDAGGVAEGRNEINLRERDVEAPAFVMLTGINPSSIVASFEKTLKKTVAVRAAYVGLPQKGYHVIRVEVEPSMIEMEGGKSVVEKLKVLQTEPVDISGATDTVVSRAFIVAPDVFLATETDTVTVRVVIGEVAQ